jgi:Secretion system C-terminal sorting domain
MLNAVKSAFGGKTKLLVFLFLAGSITQSLLFAQFTQQGPKLVGTGATTGADQGYSVAISSDGNTAIVGGPYDNSTDGAVWIFTRSGGVWTQQGPKLVGTGGVCGSGYCPQQGWSVAISSDGNTAIEGGWFDSVGVGAVWVFTRSGGVWTQQGPKLVGTGGVGSPAQGWSIAISSDGNTAIVGGDLDNNGIGAVWVFTRSGGVWTQQGTKLVGTGGVGYPQQGYSVAISSDGNTLVEGGKLDNSGAGAIWIFTRSGGVWTQQGPKLIGIGAIGLAGQGSSVSISSDGNTAIEGGYYDNSQAGAVWVFTRGGGVWTQQGAKLVGIGAVGNSQQGVSVSISSDGNTTIEGGNNDNNNAGAVWVFTRSGGVWTQQGPKLVGTGAVGTNNVFQGFSVAISSDGNTAIEGGFADNNHAGAVWVFVQAAPSAPILFSPANNSLGQGLSLNLVWYRSAGASTYRVQLSTDTGFTTLIVNDSTVTDSVKAVTGLLNNTLYYWRVNAKNPVGTSSYSGIWHFTTALVGITNNNNEIPKEFKLYNNYPNPFNPSTVIHFDIPKQSFTKLIVYDVLGKEISTLVNQQLQPGTYEVNWNASNEPSGIYFYKLSATGGAGNYIDVKKMVLIK